MAKVLYIRVSSINQNEDRQMNNLEQYDKIFQEKISGATTQRPQLQEMLGWIREGDQVDVYEISRLARNLQDLLKLVEEITKKKQSTIHFIKENLTFSAKSQNPFDELTLKLLGTFAEFERQMIRQRQAEGIQKAKEKGVYTNRTRKLKLTKSQMEEIKSKCKSRDANISQIAKAYNVSRTTICSIINRE